MRYDELLHQTFLDELRELEAFRLSHAASSLDRQDPDLRRLVEALAFFSARTHRAALESVAASRLRLFQQMLPYAVSPVPAMGLITARPGGRFVEALDLPSGTEVAVRAGVGAPASFRTLRPLRVLPLFVERVSLLPSGSGQRLVIEMETPVERRDELGDLALHVRYLGDFESSLRAVRALRASARRAAVAFDEDVPFEAAGTPCPLSFGLPLAEGEEPSHPMEEARRALHFPEAELFVSARLERPPGAWRKVALLIDLDARFPRDLKIARPETFTLFAVPMVNLDHSGARPFVFDGTTERVRIRHPDASARFALHSVRGVYRIDEGVRRPLWPALVAAGSGSYEVERAEDGDEKGHWLHLHLPEAFERPCTIAVDALWHQPAFSEKVEEGLEAWLRRHDVPGLAFEVSRPVAPAAPGAAAAGMDALLHVLGLQKRTHLERDEVMTLLDVVGGGWSRCYAPLRPLWADLRVSESPLSNAGERRGTRGLTYHLAFRSLETVAPLAESFAERLRQVLDALLCEAVAVEVEASA